MTRTELLESLIRRYPHLPQEAVVKEDLLRSGMAFSVMYTMSATI